MKTRRLLIILTYVFIGACFFEFVVTSRAIMNVESLDDALSLLGMNHLFIVRFFGVVMDYSNSIPKMILNLVRLVPVGTFLFLVLIAIKVLPYLKARYSSYMLLIPIQFLLIIAVVAFSLQSMDVKGSLERVKLLGNITFITSIIGMLTSLIIIICFGCDLIDVEDTIAYNENEENTYD